MSQRWGPLRFYRESRRYTEGYTNWHFWRMFPVAFARFYCWYPVQDFFRVQRLRRLLRKEASE